MLGYVVPLWCFSLCFALFFIVFIRGCVLIVLSPAMNTGITIIKVNKQVKSDWSGLEGNFLHTMCLSLDTENYIQA